MSSWLNKSWLQKYLQKPVRSQEIKESLTTPDSDVLKYLFCQRFVFFPSTIYLFIYLLRKE